MRFRLLLSVWVWVVLAGWAPSPARAALPHPAEEPPAVTTDFRYPSLFPQAPMVGGVDRHIEVSLKEQQLVAFEGKTPVRAFAVSTGAPGTPTPIGRYTILDKYPKIDLIGPDYYYHDVPWVMLLGKPFYIHSASWRKEFGVALSRGCVTLSVDDAAWVFDWTPMGASVYVHW
jgi:hypothetical protein